MDHTFARGIRSKVAVMDPILKYLTLGEYKPELDITVQLFNDNGRN